MGTVGGGTPGVGGAGRGIRMRGRMAFSRCSSAAFRGTPRVTISLTWRSHAHSASVRGPAVTSYPISLLVAVGGPARAV